MSNEEYFAGDGGTGPRGLVWDFENRVAPKITFSGDAVTGSSRFRSGIIKGRVRICSDEFAKEFNDRLLEIELERFMSLRTRLPMLPPIHPTSTHPADVARRQMEGIFL